MMVCRYASILTPMRFCQAGSRSPLPDSTRLRLSHLAAVRPITWANLPIGDVPDHAVCVVKSRTLARNICLAYMETWK